jgi:hypothetical protein
VPRNTRAMRGVPACPEPSMVQGRPKEAALATPSERPMLRCRSIKSFPEGVLGSFE